MSARGMLYDMTKEAKTEEEKKKVAKAIASIYERRAKWNQLRCGCGDLYPDCTCGDFRPYEWLNSHLKD